MKKFNKVLRRAVVLVAGIVFSAAVVAQSQGAGIGLEKAAAVKAARVAQLLGTEGVVGAGVGLDEVGNGAVHILVMDERAAAKMPRLLDGVPVVLQVTGEIVALREGIIPQKAPGSSGKPGAVKIDPTSLFPRPVPIGVSTGNGEPGQLCAAGTIGCRVKSTDGTVYALSNNHVYALENTAAIDDVVVQPGPYDTGCMVDPSDVIGFLAKYVPLNFSGGANYVDAALAETTTELLGTATPSNGYGTPKSTLVDAEVGQAVQKYGRTTSLTKGKVSAIDVTVDVGYGSGLARFENQITVYSRKAFLKSGDSGSLLVTDPGRNPLGLLFAGDTTGRYAVANPIGVVLTELNVTIDGE
ncbi:MAG: hypothetical protein AB9869_13180 [Verrucomicrobiia bacterium]